MKRNLICLALGLLATSNLAFGSDDEEKIKVIQKKITGSFFEGYNASFDRLLGFKWNGDQLNLRRDWFAPKVEPDPTDRFWKHKVVTPVQYEFNQVTDALGMRGSGRSGSGDRMRLSRSGDNFHCTALINGKSCQFTFVQNNEPQRRLTFEEKADGKIDILLTYDSGLINVVQKKDGKIRIVIADEELSQIYTAASFKELFEKQPEIANKVFVPFLDYLGIGRPLSSSSSEVRQFVTRQLLFGLSNSDADLNKYINQLNSRRFSERSKATDALQANFEKWRAKLEMLASDENLSLESRMRIRNIVEDAQQDQKRSVWKFVKEHKLMQDDNYLFSIADESNSKLMDAIFKQIRENKGSDSSEFVKKKFDQWKLNRDR